MYKIYNNSLGVFLLRPDLVSESLRVGNFWEEELLPIFERLTSEMVVIEVGSYIGDHTIYLSRRCKKVYAFEASTPNYYQLCANLLLNDCVNVDAHNSCIGLLEDKVRLSFVAEGNAAGTVFVKDDTGDVQVHSLDSLFLEKLDRLDCIVTDIEGMDLDALLGARELIEKFKPIVVFEFNKVHSQQPLEDYTNYLNELNYKVTQVGTWNWLAEFKG